MTDREILASLKVGDSIEFKQFSSTSRGKITKIRGKLPIGEPDREWEGVTDSGVLSEQGVKNCKTFYINGRKMK
tara:strand:+ start:1156 stop:1377 length:222 start_codon:yes stop_codon:yes gene_type:complete